VFVGNWTSGGFGFALLYITPLFWLIFLIVSTAIVFNYNKKRLGKEEIHKKTILKATILSIVLYIAWIAFISFIIYAINN